MRDKGVAVCLTGMAFLLVVVIAVLVSWSGYEKTMSIIEERKGDT